MRSIKNLLGLFLASAAEQHLRMRAVYSWNCRNIEELQVAAARWISINPPAWPAMAGSIAAW